ncbi:MAG: vWA domain-containing protein [Solirubrobacteraceae bacterium]|jgi:hypothetical protein
MSASIPLADAVELRHRARPARLLTTLLAAAAIGCAVAALLVARNPRTSTFVPLGRNANAVLVLDLSASISADTFSRIAATLRTLADSSGHFALVVFSDLAYEALPPGTPAVDLTPLIRFFTIPPLRDGQPVFPSNPWANTFTGGTSISSGMQIALQIALAQQQRPTVILVSDLDDDPGDLPALAGVLAEDRHDKVPVRLVGLSPAPEDVAFFTAVLGDDARVTDAPTLAQSPPQQTTPFPWALVALALLAAVTLGLREGWAPKLDWRRL